jgi:hypothetical protein
MSELDHSRRFDRVQLTSGLTPQADIIADRGHVSKVPGTDSLPPQLVVLFGHLVGAQQHFPPSFG